VLVEASIVAPFLLVLLTGAGQVGAVTYGLVQVDTAAREGARVGAQSPYASLNSISSSYTCSSPSDPNPICGAAYSSAGLLDKTQLTVTIAVPVTLSRLPDDIVRVASNPQQPCNGSQGRVSGSVTYGGVAIPDSWAVAVSSDGPGTPFQIVTGGVYVLCAAASPPLQNLSAVATSSPDGCTYSAVFSNVSLAKNTQYIYNFALIQSNCPASTPTPSPTPTPTPTPATSISLSATPPPAVTCRADQVVTYPTYFSVTVSYPVTIFVPFVNRYFGDAPPKDASKRTVSSTVTMQVEPCTFTQSR